MVLTFVITWGTEVILILFGFRINYYGTNIVFFQWIVAGLMWVPGIAAIITQKYILRQPLKLLNLRFGKIKPYIITALAIPVVYLIIYSLTAITLQGSPDWSLSLLFKIVVETGNTSTSEAPSPTVIISLLGFASVFVSPVINSIFGLGEEIGWRGFLLPRLMYLGKSKAYLILSFIWAMWHLPLLLVGFFVPDMPWQAFILMWCLTFSFGMFINEMTLFYKSTILAGFIHGVFNSQAYGIWRMLFPDVNYWWGGITGIPAMLMWVLLTIVISKTILNQKHPE